MYVFSVLLAGQQYSIDWVVGDDAVTTTLN